jgi:hypothetical protein
MNLNIFNTENLFNATNKLFEQLNIKLNSNTAMSIVAKDLLAEKYPANYDRNDAPKIQELYFSGRIDNSIFENDISNNGDTLDDAIKASNSMNYRGFMTFAVLFDKQPTRTQIALLSRAFNMKWNAPVMLLLKYGNFISLALPERFMYKQEWRQRTGGEQVGKIIILRDINTQNPHTGHLRILQDLAKHNAGNFNELYETWLKVLNIKTLNDDFYCRLAGKYDKSGKLVIKGWYQKCYESINIDLTKASIILNKKIDDELRPQAVIRVIIRMMFIWFMKEKGLIKNDFFKKEFAKKFLKNENTYYNAILQNLFFAVLNKKIDERRFRKHNRQNPYDPEKNDYGIFDLFRFQNDFINRKADEFKELTKTIPFVNGGLFQCHDYIFTGQDSVTNEKNNKNNYIIDGFSERKNCRAIIPDNVMFELIDLFNDYVFTIEESTPQEQDIALDPELLGTVFENLIGFYNPETKENARKQTGSFYTPREIVDYMCKESFKEAILSEPRFAGLNGLQDKIRRLIDNDEDYLDFPEKNNLIAAITDLKIIDPACGSGAFPMGMFNLMVRTIEKLQEHKTTYKNKLDIIQNCIYGIDIQNIAIEITKLRFFISLLVDYQTPDNIKDFDMLPNLETKFVVANTLIGIDLGHSSDLFENEIRQKFRALTTIFLPLTTARTPQQKTNIKNHY